MNSTKAQLSGRLGFVGACKKSGPGVLCAAEGGLADKGDDPGAAAALDAWVLATAADAVAYATSLLRDRAAAEDVVQDCYCRLLQKAAVYDLPRDGRKLLFESVTHACINQTTRGRAVRSLDGAGSLHGAVADPAALSGERVALYRELEEAVAAALARLPLPQRAALELKGLGHSQQDVARALGVTANHAGVLVHRARKAMARLLAPYLRGRVR